MIDNPLRTSGITCFFLRMMTQWVMHVTKKEKENIMATDIIIIYILAIALKWIIFTYVIWSTKTCRGLLHKRGLTSTPTWISNYIHRKVWYQITYPLSNFNDYPKQLSTVQCNAPIIDKAATMQATLSNCIVIQMSLQFVHKEENDNWSSSV